MPTLYLVGFMGSGKSTVARCLAEALECPVVDLDERIATSTGKAISDIFAEDGEEAFRLAETKELMAVSENQNATQVVALGGGAFCSPVNRRLIQNGVTVYLDVPFSALRERLQENDPERPLMGDFDSAKTLYDTRRKDYLKADIVLTLDGREAPSEVADMLRSAVTEVECVI